MSTATRCPMACSTTKPCPAANRPEPVHAPPSLKTIPFLSRRNAFLLAALNLVTKTPPATAFTLGISGPKEWLREQKKKTSKYILAPIDASRETLNTAYRLLEGPEGPGSSDNSLDQVQRLLNVAARDCVAQERNSFVAFQATTGVEVCTFQLIVNNAASLLDDVDPIKLEAEALLGDLIRTFTSLDDVAKNCDLQLPSDRQKVEGGLRDTIAALNKFEQGIKDCLGV